MSTRSNQTPFVLTPLAAGHVYLTVYGEGAPNALLIHNHLVDSAMAGQTPVWVTDQEPHLGLDDSELAQKLKQLLRQGQIQVLVQDTSGPLDRMLGEIAYYTQPRGQLVIIERFERYALAPDQGDVSRALLRLCDWTRERQCIVWGTTAESNLDTLAQAGAGIFSGISSLTYQSTHLTWVIHYWLSGQHMLSQHSVEVDQAINQQLVIDTHALDTLELEQPTGPMYDANRVIVVRGALGTQALPAGWEVVNHNQDVIAQLGEAIGCTFVLEFTPQTPLQELAQLTYRMRREAGARIHIVVREIGLHLRASEEKLLYQMGTSLIVPAEVAFARMIGLMSSQQGQIYSRPLPAEFTPLWNQSMLPMLRGYQSPTTFIEHVQQALDGATFHIHQPVLVQLQLLPECLSTPPEELLHVGRNGDIYTLFDGQLILYLHACQPIHLARVLEQLLQRPVEEVGMGQRQMITLDQIRLVLTELHQAINQRPAMLPALEEHDVRQEPPTISPRTVKPDAFAWPQPLSLKSLAS